MSDRAPIWKGDFEFKPWAPPDLRWSWVWVYCRNGFCNHCRAVPVAPWRVRWGEPDTLAAMRRRFRCGVCGTKGCDIRDPKLDYTGMELFPAGRELRMGGPNKPSPHYGISRESDAERDARVLKEYRSRFPSGDAITEYHKGPPGPAQMCGKFTAMASWAEVVAFSKPLTREEVKESDNDRVITFRVMDNLPVIICDKAAKQRRVVSMRWGWPAQKNWKIPKHIHVRGETIDTTQAFAPAFLRGQRGIVIVRTFNEAPDIPGPSIQHTITPGEVGALGIAFLWDQFDLVDPPGVLRACVMVTVPANQFIATLPTDRMPAILAPEDWHTWLGETGTFAEAKACLKTVEGVRWTMAKEEKAAKAARRPPTVSDPTGLF